jgi:hypothetical protein
MGASNTHIPQLAPSENKVLLSLLGALIQESQFLVLYHVVPDFPSKNKV